MNHPSEQDLVLHLTGDAETGDAIDRHLEDCAECAGHLRELRGVMRLAADTTVPEPDAGFEERIWQRQRTELARRGELADRMAGDGGEVVRFPTPRLRTLVWGGALAASLVLAFLLGLYTPPPGMDPSAPSVAPQDRALLVAMGAHLERTRIVLTEVANANVNDVDHLALQRARARELVDDNRLYRQSATLAGRGEYGEVLAEVERVLLELARGEGRPTSAEDLEWLRQRIEARDLLFRVRVLQAASRTPPGAAAGDAEPMA